MAIIEYIQGAVSPIALPPGAGSGDVVGPASSTNNELAMFDGVTGKAIDGSGIDAVNLAKQIRVSVDVSSTGCLGAITIAPNVDPTKFDIYIENAVIVDHTEGAGLLTYVGPLTSNATVTPFLATSTVTYIGINAAGTLELRNVPFTQDEQRTIAQAGLIVHQDFATITLAIPRPVQAKDYGLLLSDLIRSLGSINVTGNVYGAAGANMTISRSSGSLFFRSGDFVGDATSPNFINTTLCSPCTFYGNYRDAGSSVTVDITTLITDKYDDGTGTLATMSNNHATVHRIYYFGGVDVTMVEVGQTDYATFAAAETGYLTETFEERNDISEPIFMAWLIVSAGTTNLTTAVAGGTAKFIQASKFQAPSF